MFYQILPLSLPSIMKRKLRGLETRFFLFWRSEAEILWKETFERNILCRILSILEATKHYYIGFKRIFWKENFKYLRFILFTFWPLILNIFLLYILMKLDVKFDHSTPIVVMDRGLQQYPGQWNILWKCHAIIILVGWFEKSGGNILKINWKKSLICTV